MTTRRQSVDQRGQRREALLRAYVAPEVVAHIMSDGQTTLLSGVRLPVTVLFADIRNFTRMADRLPAERVATMLDEFFDAMMAAATAHHAVIDKLIGDAIMLVYGVPASQGDEARRALDTAAEMHGAFVALLDRWRASLPKLRLGLAIGCASGEVVLANVGSAARMDYTIIGAVVNLAARLTAAAGSGETLVSAAVRDAISGSVGPGLGFGRPRHLWLKGFRRRVAAYAWRPAARRAAAPLSSTVSDPVCGMKLNIESALSLVHRREIFYFCSAKCRTKFRRSPKRYVVGLSPVP